LISGGGRALEIAEAPSSNGGNDACSHRTASVRTSNLCRFFVSLASDALEHGCISH
jgi:hypothetical protein